MGTDIHIVIEQKFGGKWIGVRTDTGLHTGHYSNPNTGNWVRPAVGQRDYAFFGRLAGVRRPGPGPEARGIPDDASDLTRAMVAQWDGDGHNFSHLSLMEFALRWCADDETFMAEMSAQRLAGKTTLLYRLLDRASMGAAISCEDADEIRVVFWFDN